MNYLSHFPALRDSGVDWLGLVPEHWEIRRLQSIAELAASNVDKIPTEGEDQVRLCNYTDVYHRRRITNDIEFMNATASEDEIRRFSLRAGDVMFTKDSESFDDIGIPAVADDGLENVVLGYHLMLARPTPQLHGPYLAWFFTPQRNRWQFEVSAKGVTRFGMPQAGFKDALVPLPPLAEQRAIAGFLDAMDARITRFIAGRKKMIRLLEEKKQAVINGAVTRGLDPDVPMKDSGVDWLGDIPAHWEVRPIKRALRNLDHRRVPLSSTDRGHMTLRKYDYYGASGVIDQVDDYLFDDDLLLIAEDGANLVLRNLSLAIIARGRFWVNNHAHILKPTMGSLEYFAYLLEAVDYRPWISGAAQPKLTQDRLMSIQIPIPPPHEQEVIVDYITSIVRDSEAIASRARREIELVQEYRTRLISDVVTGKLDVRGVNLGELPEFDEIPDAEEPLDSDDDNDHLDDETDDDV